MGRIGEKETASIQSVERAVEILFLLADAQTILSVSEIAERLGVHVSTASRLLSTLAKQNVVVQTRDGYRLGLGLLRLTHVVLTELHIRSVAHQHLQRLCHQVNKSIYLATWYEGDEIYIDQFDPDDAMSKSNWIGHTIPAHTASGGKVLLAHISDEELDEYFLRGLQLSTRHTITDEQELRGQLMQIRKQGYATSRDESIIGFSNVAAPIYDRTHKNVAVVAASGASSELSAKRLHEMAGLVVATANAISLELGFHSTAKGDFSNDSRSSGTYRLTHH